MKNKEMLDKVQDIRNWYWTYGKNWDIKSRISPTILLELNKLENSLRTSLNKDTVPIWGPSQSGKSVFVSKTIDYFDGTSYDSAISWDRDDKIIFSKDLNFSEVEEKPKVFNQNNKGADSTISATRFYLPKNPNSVNTQYPVTVLTGSIENILHTIAEGYLYSIEEITDQEEIDKDYLEGFLNNEYDDTKLDETINEESFNLISNVINVIDNLMFLNRRRFIKLNKNNSWSHLRERILTNEKLTSNIDTALGFTRMILWDNREDVNEIFNSVLITYNKINEVLDNKKLVCTVATASKLSSLIENSNKLYFSLLEDKDEIILTLTDKNRGKEFRLNNFHAIILEIQIPLREEVVCKINQNNLAFFKKCDLLDLPGSTIMTKQINEEVEIVEEEIIKRGRTASTIFNYAETLQFSAILFNLRAGKADYDLKEMTQGIELIYSKLDSNYYENIKKQQRNIKGLTNTPIPLQIIFSFFNKPFIDFLDSHDSGEWINSLNIYNSFMSGKVELLSPANTYSFATMYYWFRNTALPLKKDYSILKDKFKNVKWFNDRFLLDGEKESVYKLIENEKSGDGGISYVLEATLKILDEHSNKVDRDSIYGDKLNNIISQITPTDRNDKENTDKVYKEFIQMLDDKFEYYKENDIEDTIDDILIFSKNLRDLRSFDSNDIEYISSIDISSKNFYNQIINKWIAKRIVIIQQLGFEKGKSKIIAEVLAEKISNTEEIQVYIEDIFMDQTTKPEEKVLHRLIAKRIAYMLRNVEKDKDYKIDEARKNCEDIFNKYKGSNKKAVIANMHLNNIIDKHIKELKLIKANLSQGLQDLDGIDQLKEITNLTSKGAESVYH